MTINYNIVSAVPEDAEDIVNTLNLIGEESNYLNFVDNIDSEVKERRDLRGRPDDPDR